VSTILYTQDILSLPEIATLAFFGAILADHFGYYLGLIFGPHVEKSKFARSREKNIKKSKEIVLKYGTFSIIIGRLIPAVRSLVPLTVGISALGKLKFSISDFCACFIWSCGLLLLSGGIGNVFLQ
tara:strand:- start:702 stop:1079 length:378 start_codon:yes stop_codon:yes gene_type:complete